jgi:glucan phosphorylase
MSKSTIPGTEAITARLYIGDLEQRLRQEIVLGLGGRRCSKPWASIITSCT